MTRAAEIGRGTFTFIGDAAQVQSRMDDLFTKIGQPVVTGLAAKLSGQVAITPDPLPDLYRGEPVLMMAAAKTLTGNLELTGMIGDTPWSVTLPVDKAAQGKGISKLWAHRKVADLEVASTMGTLEQDQANKMILAVALEHQIVSSQTSLIAVDKSPKRPADQPLTRAEVPLNLPAGWNFDKVFGKDVWQMPADTRKAEADSYLQLASSAQPKALSATPDQVQLPQTATPAGLLAIIGSLLAGLAMVLRFFAVRRNFVEV
jgi:Ca-activated chloride channel family protein